jgi:hypothetical protein
MLKIELSHDPAVITFGHISKAMKINIQETYLHTHDYSSAIHNNQDMEPAHRPKKWIKKMCHLWSIIQP